ncbi:peptidyl-prolyl cis-trans isomerase 7-like [Macrosteles quadrilineatus]|uniref:peptidyl-prolyl cis-trans isomerase 7-like n=1 Tax=Macrosteles quadrilineatus TaxID=74068 RepID=UPI0023E1EFAC|nr:peptidyl-prolyl cis-trans isomerase 7-like [Macrosteles quadrilineatus]
MTWYLPQNTETTLQSILKLKDLISSLEKAILHREIVDYQLSVDFQNILSRITGANYAVYGARHTLNIGEGKEIKNVRPRCFFDIEVGENHIGRIIFELYSDLCPKICENFIALCNGDKGLGSTTGKPLHYKGTVFHRVVKDFMIQGGDFTAMNGSGGESIYGGMFEDENLTLKHDKPLLLSMVFRQSVPCIVEVMFLFDVELVVGKAVVNLMLLS